MPKIQQTTRCKRFGHPSNSAACPGWSSYSSAAPTKGRSRPASPRSRHHCESCGTAAPRHSSSGAAVGEMRPKTPPPEHQLLPKKSNGQQSERGYGPSCLKPLLSRLWLDDTTGCFAKVHLAFPKKASSEPELKLYEEAKAAAMALVELGQKHPDPKKAAPTTPASGALLPPIPVAQHQSLPPLVAAAQHQAAVDHGNGRPLTTGLRGKGGEHRSGAGPQLGTLNSANGKKKAANHDIHMNFWKGKK